MFLRNVTELSPDYTASHENLRSDIAYLRLLCFGGATLCWPMLYVRAFVMTCTMCPGFEHGCVLSVLTAKQDISIPHSTAPLYEAIALLWVEH
jgi:hypothetical protein